jgi:DNA-binding transcriptional LysR family regulator
MVNFEWYRTFKAIYQYGTLTGAAQELLISQPNVSQHLSALESYIGHQLFERKPRKMVPTEYGKLFYTQIIEAVERLENVEVDFKRSCLTKNLPLICIGAPKEYFHTVLAQQIGEAKANLVVEFGITEELLHKMIRGDLYFVVATQVIEEKNIVYEPVLKEQFLLVGSPGLNTSVFDTYILQGEKDKAEHWLYEQNWFAYSSDLMIIRRFWQKNFGKRPLIKPRFIIPDFNAITKAMSYGEGVSIVSDYLVKDMLEQGQLKVLWEGVDCTTNTIYLAYDKTRVTTAQILAVKNILMPALTLA